MLFCPVLHTNWFKWSSCKPMVYMKGCRVTIDMYKIAKGGRYSFILKLKACMFGWSSHLCLYYLINNITVFGCRGSFSFRVFLLLWQHRFSIQLYISSKQIDHKHYFHSMCTKYNYFMHAHNLCHCIYVYSAHNERFISDLSKYT